MRTSGGRDDYARMGGGGNGGRRQAVRCLDARIGLLIIAGAFGVLSVAAAFAIHQKSLLTPWLALGAIPALVGILFVF